MTDQTQQILAHLDKVRLRRTTEDDLDFVLKTEHDGENSPYIFVWNREQHIQSFSNPNVAHLIIESIEGPEVVGYAILNGLESPNQSIELQRLAVAAKGKGYGKEAVELIKQWTFEELKPHRLWLDLKDYNKRAQHVYESVGFVMEGTLRECLKVGDTFESLIIMSVLQSEYLSQKERKA